MGNPPPLTACREIALELRIASSVCDDGHLSKQPEIEREDRLKVDLFHRFGVALRRLGHLDTAESILQEALRGKPRDSFLLLSLANVNQVQAQRFIWQLSSNQDPVARLSANARLQDRIRYTFNAYEKLIDGGPGQDSAVIAAANWLELYAMLDRFGLLQKGLNQPEQRLNGIVQYLDSTLPLGAKSLSVRAKFAEALVDISQRHPSLSKETQHQAKQLYSDSSNERQGRARIQALALMGELLRREKKYSEALELIQQGIDLAESIRAYDLAYAVQWAAGRIHTALGKTEVAVINYRAAISNIERIRSGSLAYNVEKQYAFRDEIEPVYRELMGLLSASPDPDLKEILEINERLQIAELENYLQCGRLPLKSLLAMEESESPDAALYLVRVGVNYRIILRSKSGTLRQSSLDGSELETALHEIQKTLQGDRFRDLSEREYQDLFGRLYRALLLPIEAWLPEAGTVVISVDSKIQGIPWSLMYDGKRYLAERYSLAYTLGSRIKDPLRLSKHDLAGVVAGLSLMPKGSEELPLPNVQQEAQTIASILPKSKVFLNERFTLANLQQIIGRYPILHLATHGQFSSNPTETYLQSWTEKITPDRLEILLRKAPNPIELLVLSACETAAGDSRATLGIAGTTVKSGARAALASIWQVDDSSQSLLIGEFYRALTEGQTKAEALRSAQLKMMSSAYRSPYYWGSVVLVGSWL
ncbi:MAG: CHAT domain-containing protein [Thermosynechococcaceae cyanobacterium]